MTSATEPKETTARPSSEAQSYWSLALRDFRRNRLAMAAICFVAMIVLVAIFTPLIANNRPLYFKAAMPAEFENEAFIAWESAEAIRLALDNRETGKIPDLKQNLESHLDALAPFLLDAEQGEIEAFRGKITAQLSAYDADEFSAALLEFEDRFVYGEVELQPVASYPALRALTKRELFFIAAFGYILICGMVSRLFSHRRLLVVLAAIPLAWLTTHGLRTKYPPIEDNRQWAQIIAAAGETAEVVRTPIPFGENENILEHSRAAPSFHTPQLKLRDGNLSPNPHLLGTDTNGRDVFCRIVYGARVSMIIGVLAVLLYIAIGVVIGAVAGFYGGWVDIFISRIIEVVICFPFLMVILSVQAFLEPSVFNLVLALGFLAWTGVARLQRGEFLRLVNMDFVQSVRALGGSNLRIIFLHILPNAIGPILIVMSFGIPATILVESTLSFLGFGVPQPQASWGDLLNNGRSDPQGLWWLVLFPGLILFMTLTCFNLVGEGIRDALDPRRDR